MISDLKLTVGWVDKRCQMGLGWVGKRCQKISSNMSKKGLQTCSFDAIYLWTFFTCWHSFLPKHDINQIGKVFMFGAFSTSKIRMNASSKNNEMKLYPKPFEFDDVKWRKLLQLVANKVKLVIKSRIVAFISKFPSQFFSKLVSHSTQSTRFLLHSKVLDVIHAIVLSKLWSQYEWTLYRLLGFGFNFGQTVNCITR